jgi:hypothetical protein
METDTSSYESFETPQDSATVIPKKIGSPTSMQSQSF